MKDTTQNLEKAKGHLADAKGMVLKLFEGCPYCNVDKRFSSDDEVYFTFFRSKNEINQFLHVKVSWALKEFEGKADSLNMYGFRSLEIRLHITDQEKKGFSEVVFTCSTVLGTSATHGDCGVVTQVWNWMEGFVRNWVLQEKTPGLEKTD